MSTKWTREQEQAIYLRDRDILVSAAAGSGKTAVLVERILSRVTDPEHPVDIDRLLVVTFTRAAAAEMKTRIGRALEERLAADPGNEHLQRQSILLHHAQISTIHSFCTYVIQNYFHRIALDPNYRIANEGELRLLRGEVMTELMEEEYARAGEGGNSAFLELTEALSPGRTDRAVEEMILQVANYATSDPDPEDWLSGSVELLAATTAEELDAAPWMRETVADVRLRLHGLLEIAKKNLTEAQAPGGPAAYVPALESDISLLAELGERSSYSALCAGFAECRFAKLSTGKKEAELPLVREKIKNARDGIKKAVEDLQKLYFSRPAEEELQIMALARPLTSELVRLAGAFLKRLSEEKRARGIMEFSDLEHSALSILLEKTEGGGWVRTEAARELAGQYEEILIDEYQDSNALQEIILEAVSRSADGRANRFLVGDIKQSIYGFRMARPELFLEKYDRYSTGNAMEQRVDLGKNFRSRVEVLDIVNAVFSKLMTGALGGIVYDDAARLYAGAEYPAPAGTSSAEAELLLIEEPSYLFAQDDRREALEQTEALAVASRIRALVQSGQVYDAADKCYRPARYSDCVVLLRSASDTYVRILQEAGIPAHAESKEGYFSAIEVTTVLNYLRICDNPRQDIPLAAVLRSPIVGMSDAGLAQLRCTYPEIPLWDAVRGGAEKDPALASFVAQLERFRELASELSVHAFIQRMIEETGYGLYAAAMPAGEQREANLRMLIERAVEFENTSYHGLFRFIRYIEDLEKYKIDFGEVNMFGEAENTVRVMTIHKSKGLEFPFVFVSNLGHGFNFQDSRRAIAMHARLGVAVDAVDLKNRVRWTTLPKTVVRQRIESDMLAEEMRVLYVAMTRAREKLILTGSVKSIEKELALAEDGVHYERLVSAGKFLDWILPAISGGAPIRIVRVDPQELSLAARSEKERQTSIWEVIADPSVSGNPAIRERLVKQQEFHYPYAYLEQMPAKMTVTELKRASLADLAEEAGQEVFSERPVVPYLPRFMREAEEVAGAARGTVYHRVWEHIDYMGRPDEAGVRAQLQSMVENGTLLAEEAASVDVRDVMAFLTSSLGARMREAAENGRLRREQPFVFLVPAQEVDPGLPAGESILVQGVMDAFFEEDGKYVLVDYKTDRVEAGDADGLVAKYAVQLQYYRRALEQITGREVAQMFLYSTSLGREIPVAL